MATLDRSTEETKLRIIIEDAIWTINHEGSNLSVLAILLKAREIPNGSKTQVR